MDTAAFSAIFMVTPLGLREFEAAHATYLKAATLGKTQNSSDKQALFAPLITLLT